MRPNSKSRIAATLLLAASLAGSMPDTAAAQNPPPPPPPQGAPTFRESVEVRVMDLDVSVTDSKGNPVTDLTKDDFRVTVDGKPIPIDYFARVAEGTIHAPDMASASPDRILAEYKKADESYIPREFLMYVDVGNLSPNNKKRGCEALRDLVQRMGPSDRGRLVLFDRRAKPQTEWTPSKEELFAALSKLESTGVGMSRLQAETQALHQIDQTRQRSSRQFAARSYAEETRVQVANMLKDMSAELTTLSALPGKRAFIFVGGGFDMQPGFAMMQYATGTFSLAATDIRDMSNEVNALVRKANSSDVTFYTVDARGLTAEGTSASEDDPLMSRPGVSFFARQDSQAGYVELANQTGGIALLNSNALAPGLSRVYQDVSTYYSVGVTLSKLPGEGQRKVAVTVTRAGTTVRARRTYSPRSPAERAGDVAVAALRSNVQYQGIPVTLSTSPASKQKKYWAMPVVLTVPASGLTFLPEGQNLKANADVYFAVMDDSGNMSDLTREEAAFTLPPEAPKDAVVRYTANLQIRKGNARIVANVRDRETGKMGTARADVHVE
jgi:VWFA-related protein